MNIDFFLAKTCDTSTGNSIISPDSLPKTCADKGALDTILLISFTVIGALALLMIVIAGFRYVLSGGQPDKVAEAKRQIIFAFVGLVVAASAAAIVNFVLGKT